MFRRVAQPVRLGRLQLLQVQVQADQSGAAQADAEQQVDDDPVAAWTGVAVQVRSGAAVAAALSSLGASFTAPAARERWLQPRPAAPPGQTRP
ncbi:hypothetical protein ACIBI9_57800 [Nonomuraea sp. NPDC050451]|uniref:hypothetical protein n=1 Tax=Nonomuraea sp. NPDC050451 TaxID=3364364 RepID=UPI0037964E9F